MTANWIFTDVKSRAAAVQFILTPDALRNSEKILQMSEKQTAQKTM
jgi:hypothetical protein